MYKCKDCGNKEFRRYQVVCEVIKFDKDGELSYVDEVDRWNDDTNPMECRKCDSQDIVKVSDNESL